jgi:uncharacterized paraquat-inducible protein A
MKTIYGVILLIATTFIFTACSVNMENKEQTEQTGKEYTAAYICPMHCEGSGSDKEGTCPVCGMDYEKNEKHNNEEHSH